MDEDEINKLSNRGILVDLPDGQTGVPVTIQDTRRFTTGTRMERRASLEQEFRAIALKEIEPEGGKVDINSISTTGQTVEAVIPADKFDQIKQQIETKGVRIDILQSRQILNND